MIDVENWCWNDIFELLENNITGTRVFPNFKIIHSLPPSYLPTPLDLLNVRRLENVNKINLNNKKKSIHT